MINRDFLKSWIEAQHLEDAALEQYRDAFLSHPARLLRINDFLQPDVAERLSRFLREEAEFVTEYGLYAPSRALSERNSGWRPATTIVSSGCGSSKEPRQFQVSRNALTYVQFRQAFQRQEFRAFFRTTSDLRLVGATISARTR